MTKLAPSLLLAVVFVACASEDDDDGVRPPSEPARAYAKAYCERLARCRPRGTRNNFGSAAGCADQLVADLDEELARTAPQAITACITALGAAPCDVLTRAIPECQFRGTLPDGAVCGSGYHCASGSCFRPDGADGEPTLCGTCSARVGEGTTCMIANCENDLTCAGGICRRPVGLGELCNRDSAPCKTGLLCVEGRCATPLAEGEACTPPGIDPSKTRACDENATCVSGTCSAVGWAAVGERCGTAETGAVVACTASTCSTTTGTCVADLREGEACTGTGTPCAVPLVCKSGKCTRESIATCR